jgi:hypothetical protein
LPFATRAKDRPRRCDLALKTDPKRILADAWAIAAADRALLIPVAGMFYFLPQLALRLFVVDARSPKAPPPQDWNEALAGIRQFYLDHLTALAAAELWTIAGTLLLLLFYLRRGSDLRGAFSAMLPVIPSYLLLALLLNTAIAAGFLAFLLPGYYLFGRLLLASPILAAERRIGAIKAIERSWSMSRGRGFVFAGLGIFPTVMGYLAGLPVEALGDALNRAPLANPVSAMLIETIGAAIVCATMLATTLIRVSLYRRMEMP